LYLHGGPGGGLGQGYRRWFDAETTQIVSFEQRGCGRSRPLVTDALDAIATNTTSALLADIEALRGHLGISRWLVVGVSWGTTLALAYAQAHPERVTALALAAVTTTSAAEVTWLTEDMARVFPREHEAFREAAAARPGERLVDAYYRQLTAPEPAVRDAAAKAWCAWEDTHVSLDPLHQPEPRFRDPVFRAVFATLVVHYWRNAGFVGAPGLLAEMDKLVDVPGVLLHGRLDVSSPLQTAYRLHRAWPGSELVVLPHEGHGGPVMMAALTDAIARLFASVSRREAQT
jgi:proline iminopeptidase